MYLQNKFHGLILKPFWENVQNSHFTYFFVIKDPLKKLEKNILARVLGNVVVNIQTKFRKDRRKTEGAYSI